MARDDGEKLWRYADLARLWSWCLIGVGAALLALSASLAAGGDDGLDGGWLAVALGTAAATGVIMFFVLRAWLRRGAMPSVRLPDAVKAGGRRRMEASPRDWRRWATITALIMLVSGAAMLLFLVAVLGGGGTAEGVVAGVLVAWGAATLEDVRRIRSIERDEGRRYYAACRRPTGVGNSLVWVRTADA